MNYQHQELADGRWFELSFFEQMANIGSEIHRTISWREKNTQDSQLALERGLELLDLTIADEKNHGRLGELLRLREVIVDYFVYDNIYGSSDKLWQDYFYCFNYAARV